MTSLPVTIAKEPALNPAEDYYRLRREGIGFIEQMGSALWTDYNTHDPGITILEALCYAITDLAYRAGWDIKDILSPEIAPADRSQPYPDQAFFSARQILTVNPTTPDDFRRLLINLDAVRNAWVFCKQCACDLSYYAWCELDKLLFSYQAPPDVKPAPQPIAPRGLYNALLELESDPELGDLNDRKIEFTSIFHDAGGAHPTVMEMRFPEIDLPDRDGWARLLDSDDAFAGANGESFTLNLSSFGATKSYDLFSDAALDDDGRNGYLRSHWRGVFYLSFEIQLLPAAKEILIENATLRLYSDAAARDASTAQGLKAILEEPGAGGFLLRFRKKVRRQVAAVVEAKGALIAHRNLDEDYCRVRTVGIEEVAACADIEVKPDADIELVQARIWFEIQQYFNPPVPFYTLQELLDAGRAVEEIFDGPELESGFLKEEDLQAASLKTVLRVSDIVNRLMEIEGVVAVNQLQLTGYDSEGNAISGAADPTWSAQGDPIFDPNKVSASWLLYLSDQHQPRLYLNASRFLFYKNGLSFLPRKDEASDTLTQLLGEAERSKNKNAPKDLPVPVGNFRNPEDYFPVQYSFPLTYGIGPDGLASQVGARRRAQARQLKAYLMVFEQLLGDAFAQIAHAADLFSLDPAIDRTYFVRQFTKDVIVGYDEIVNGLNLPALESMTETVPEFLERRNRFLDHLMARFGEQFGEYALVLNDLQGQQIASEQLIKDKISFLKSYPGISHDRGKAFNYRVNPCAADNQSGLLQRVKRLLGIAGSSSGERSILVEHLLLRPKFPGDALYPACSEGACRTCGDEDPYSFRLTFVMPGWAEPFASNLEMRGFADRTIRQETPAHLLAKICWVGNDGFAPDPCDPVIGELVQLLEGKGLAADGSRPTQEEACACAAAIYDAFSAVFQNWYQDKTLNYQVPEMLRQALQALFAGQPNPADIACVAVLEAALWAEIQTLMVDYFQQVALRGWQFERFADAWCAWLTANAGFDWTEERLLERLAAIMAKNLAPGQQQLSQAQLCQCAAVMLADCGQAFYNWMRDNFQAGKSWPDLGAFVPPAVQFCADFNAGTAELIGQLLEERYNAYREVSYRLWMVVGLLANLSNTYPAATLHDCDQGNDRNPVRLDQTALGR